MHLRVRWSLKEGLDLKAAEPATESLIAQGTDFQEDLCFCLHMNMLTSRAQLMSPFKFYCQLEAYNLKSSSCYMQVLRWSSLLLRRIMLPA